MHIFILGGNAPHNKDWAHQLAGILKHLAQHTTVPHYAHWETDEPFMDLDAELSKLAVQARHTQNEYVFVAKSMGSILAAKGIHEASLKPYACIFIGVPLNLIVKEKVPFAEWLAGASNILFVQHSHDPVGSAEALASYLKQHNLQHYKFIELPGDTHNYTDLQALHEHIARHLQR